MTTLQLHDSSSFAVTDVQAQVCHPSVIVPITERHDDLYEIYQQTAAMLAISSILWSLFLSLTDRNSPSLYPAVYDEKDHNNIRIIRFSKTFGEPTALAVGFEQARGQIIITLSPYLQVEPAELLKMLSRLEFGADLVISRRYTYRFRSPIEPNPTCSTG